MSEIGEMSEGYALAIAMDSIRERIEAVEARGFPLEPSHPWRRAITVVQAIYTEATKGALHER